MARDVDTLISHVKQLDWPPVMKQIVVNRLDPNPTPEEIERAAKEVYGGGSKARPPYEPSQNPNAFLEESETDKTQRDPIQIPHPYLAGRDNV